VPTFRKYRVEDLNHEDGSSMFLQDLGSHLENTERCHNWEDRSMNLLGLKMHLENLFEKHLQALRKW
jgi:hypothetical protein